MDQKTVKLLPAEPSIWHMLSHRLVSETGLIHMGVYPVLYGFRVRAGYCTEDGCSLDWCGGGNWKDVERLYSLCKAVLEKREETPRRVIDVFDGLPGWSIIKPFFKDKEFVRIVGEQAGNFQLISLDRNQVLSWDQFAALFPRNNK